MAVTRSDPVAESPSKPRPEWQQLGFAPWVEPTYRWFRPVLPVLGIYAMVRVGLAVADALAAHLSYGTHPDGPLTAWDGHWYLAVAARGYPAVAPTAAGHLTYGAAGFEPVFPALIRVMEAAGFTSIQAAVAVSIVAGAVSVVLVWRLATVLFDEQVGRIAAILFIVFPGMAIAWGMTYSESVGMALAAGCLLLMVEERWFWAGVSGALATATSPMALPLAVAALGRRDPVGTTTTGTGCADRARSHPDGLHRVCRRARRSVPRHVVLVASATRGLGGTSRFRQVSARSSRPSLDRWVPGQGLDGVGGRHRGHRRHCDPLVRSKLPAP